MDRIKKLLSKLSKKELSKVLAIMEKIEEGEVHDLDVKKLSGHKNIYQARAGKIRILFVRSKDGYWLITAERRSETTYKI